VVVIVPGRLYLSPKSTSEPVGLRWRVIFLFSSPFFFLLMFRFFIVIHCYLGLFIPSLSKSYVYRRLFSCHGLREYIGLYHLFILSFWKPEPSPVSVLSNVRSFSLYKCLYLPFLRPSTFEKRPVSVSSPLRKIGLASPLPHHFFSLFSSRAAFTLHVQQPVRSQCCMFGSLENVSCP